MRSLQARISLCALRRAGLAMAALILGVVTTVGLAGPARAATGLNGTITINTGASIYYVATTITGTASCVGGGAATATVTVTQYSPDFVIANGQSTPFNCDGELYQWTVMVHPILPIQSFFPGTAAVSASVFRVSSVGIIAVTDAVSVTLE